MVLVDSHTHCYAGEFDADRKEVVSRALEVGVTFLLMPAIDQGHTERMMRMAGEFPGICFPMTGLHPTSVNSDFAKEMEHVRSMLAEGAQRFCAIGEVGIDLYWDKTYQTEQIEVFNQQTDLAVEYDLPLVIHTRNSMDLALDILTERNDRRIRGVFHCFSGNTAQARRAVDLGFLLGIGGVVTYRNSGLQAVVENIPADKLLLETDAPWLTPVPHRGKRNEPSFLPLIAQKTAEIKQIPVEEIARITTANALGMFGIGA